MVFTLPKPTGRYQVGSTTFAAAVHSPDPKELIIGDAKLKQKPNEPALTVSEICFTAYYPADLSNKTRKIPNTTPWLGKPAREYLQGYGKFGGLGMPLQLLYWLFSLFAFRLKIPAYPNVPLLSPSKREESPDEPWPLVIFSHGLGGTRTNYSQYCTRLASDGRVVLAIEHRDGTAPFVPSHTKVPGKKYTHKPITKLYLDPDVDIQWEGGARDDEFAIRLDQLVFRRLEIYLTYLHFKDLIHATANTLPNDFPAGEIHTVDGPWNLDWDRRSKDRDFWASWMTETASANPKVKCTSDITLIGHSFGGATVLSLLSRPPPTLAMHELQPLPTKIAIALDPWLEPFSTPGPKPWHIESSAEQHVGHIPKLLVLNSEGFTLWDGHFQQLEEIVRVWNESDENTCARLYSIMRSRHISFSDFLILASRGQRRRDAMKLLGIIVELSSAWMDGNFDDVLSHHVVVKDPPIEKKTKPRTGEKGWDRQFVGNLGDIVDHGPL